jgi:hypothetical protein
MTEYIIMVTGSRDWDDNKIIEESLKTLQIPPNLIPVLVHGGCNTGADSMANSIAQNLGWKIRIYHAKWDKYGKSAGPLRNCEMVQTEQPHVVIGFSKNNSRGTQHACDTITRYSANYLCRLKYFFIYEQNNNNTPQKHIIINKN